jgi:GNAT superfamily N-acetyltransferase
VSDAGEIARIQLATWRVAYQRLVPKHVLEEISEDFLRERWSAAVGSPPGPHHRVLIAIEQTVQDYVVGFLASAPDDDDPGMVAITELLVEPRWGRRGHGSRLLAAAVDLWRQDGFKQARAWSFERDIPMAKFLTEAGWAKDGYRRELDIDDLMVPQVRWHVSLERLEELAEPDGEPGAVDH